MKAIEESVLYGESQIRSLHSVSKEFKFNWHYHNELEISLILRGRGVRYTGNTIDSFTARELLFIPPRVPHSWQSDRDETDKEVIVFQFRSDFLGGRIGTGDTASLRSLFAENRALKVDVTDELVALALCAHEAVGLPRLLVFLEFLALIQQGDKTLVNDDAPRPMDGEGQLQFEVIADYIAAHWDEEIRVPALAAHCGMSESTFRRFFVRATGRSFVGYLNAMRISKACELLGSGTRSITDIWIQAGFRNGAFFNRKFKELKGMTPREYRRRYESHKR